VLPVPTVGAARQADQGIDQIVEQAPRPAPDDTSAQGHAPVERL